MIVVLRRLSFWTEIVMALVLIGALVEMQDFRAGARFIPLLFAWITLGLIGLDLLRQLVQARQRDRGTSARPPSTAAPAEALRVIAYVAIFWLFVLMFGFYGGPALLIAAYLLVEANVRWPAALGAAVFGNLAILWGMGSLGVRIWTGAGPELWPGLIGGESWPMF